MSTFLNFIESELEKGQIGSFIGGRYFKPSNYPNMVHSKFYEYSLITRDSPTNDLESIKRLCSEFKSQSNKPTLQIRFDILTRAAEIIDFSDKLLTVATKLNGTTLKELKFTTQIGLKNIFSDYWQRLENRGYGFNGNSIFIRRENAIEVYKENTDSVTLVLPSGDLSSHFYGIATGFLSGAPLLIRSPRTLIFIDLIIVDAIVRAAEEFGFNLKSFANVITTSHENETTNTFLKEFSLRERTVVFGSKDTTEKFGAGIPFHLSVSKWIIGPKADPVSAAKIITQAANRDVTACDTPRICYVDPNIIEALTTQLILEYDSLRIGNPLDDNIDIGLSEPEVINSVLCQIGWRLLQGYETIEYPIIPETLLIGQNPTKILERQLVTFRNQKAEPIQLKPMLIKAYGPRAVYVKDGDTHLNLLVLRQATLPEAIDEIRNLPPSIAIAYINDSESKDLNVLSNLAEQVSSTALITGSSTKMHDIGGPHEGIHLLTELMRLIDIHL